MLEQLALISILTSLVTEAVKKLLTEMKVNYSCNVIASIVSVILTIGVKWYTLNGTMSALTTADISEIVALMLLSFLSATLGYDKVIQTLKQLR